MMKNNIRPEWALDRESWFNMVKNNIRPELASDRVSWFNMMKNNIMPRVGIRQREMVQHDEKQHYAQSGHQTERAGST